MCELSHRIQPGETISAILEWAGVGPGQADEWVRATSEVYDVDRIHIGQELSLVIDTRSSDLHHLALEIDPMSLLVAKREASRVITRPQPIRHYRRMRVSSGTINSSLYEAALGEGIPEKIILELANILSGELDLARDLHPGASFRVAYEELTRGDGTTSIPGRVAAAEITNRGRSYQAYSFAMPDGSRSGYYNGQGKALGRNFARYPVTFSRISSGFSKGRFHPTLKRRVPHYGVDLAAPRGAPVKAIADGTVRKAGWYGKNGRLVKIRHGTVYESGYAHLSRIAGGIKPGVTVRQGQVVGYVGSTGRATGPHLHFSMSRNGTYIDPLKARNWQAPPLSGPALATFRATVANIERACAQSGGREGPTHVANATGTEYFPSPYAKQE